MLKAQLLQNFLSMFRKTLVCKATFSTVNFMKSKYRSNISHEHSTFKLRCFVMIYIPELKTQYKKRNVNYLTNDFLY